MKKQVSIAIIIVILISGGILSYNFMFKNNKADKKPNQYTGVKVKKGDIEKVISGSGSVLASEMETLKSSYRENVKEVLVKNNQKVKEGEVLVNFESGNNITASYEGVVTEISINEGDSVNTNQALMKIMNSKNLITKINVDEKDLASIKNGQVVNLTASAYENEKFSGKVTQISEQGEYTDGVSEFEVTVTIDDVKNLKIGMSIESKIIVQSKKNTLILPINAVKGTGNEKSVLVDSGENQLDTIKVKTGIVNDSYIEILSGISEGKEVMIKNNVNADKMDLKDKMGNKVMNPKVMGPGSNGKKSSQQNKNK